MPQDNKYKHAVVSGIGELIETWIKPAVESDSMLKVIFGSIEPQIPLMLQALDDNEKVVSYITVKMRELLEAEQCQQAKSPRQQHGELLEAEHQQPKNQQQGE